MHPLDRLNLIHSSWGDFGVIEFFRHLYDSTKVNVRLIWDRGKGSHCPQGMQPIIEVTVDVADRASMNQLVEMNAKGYNVYFIPQISKKVAPGAFIKDEDITQIRSLFIDHDAKKGQVAWQQCVEAGAHYIIETSPGNFHAYWLVEDFPGVDAFKMLIRRLQKRFEEAFEVDRSVQNPARLMRMPGFINNKDGADGHVVGIIHESKEQPYSFKSHKQLMRLFGAAGRNDLFQGIIGFDGGFTVAKKINAKLFDPLPDAEMKQLEKNYAKYQDKKEAENVLTHLAWVRELKAYIDISNGAERDEKQIRNEYGPKAFIALQSNFEKVVYERVRFRPDYKCDPDEYNAYRDLRVPSNPGGDIRWFHKVLDANFTKDDRAIVEQFMAAVCCHPDKRLEWGLLVIGKQEGTGKSSLYHIMRGILHERHTVHLNGDKLRKEFNGFLENKLLVYIDEIMHEGRHDIVNKIKDWFTEEQVSIEKKGKDIYLADNFAKIYLTSNYDRPLSLKGDSRRFAVVNTRDDAKKPLTLEEYHYHLHNSLGAVRAYLETVDISDLDFTRAPDSQAKKDLQYVSNSAWEEALVEWAEQQEGPYCFPGSIEDILCQGNRGIKRSVIRQFLVKNMGMRNLTKDFGWRYLTLGKYLNYTVFTTKDAKLEDLADTLENRKRALDALKEKLA